MHLLQGSGQEQKIGNSVLFNTIYYVGHVRGHFFCLFRTHGSLWLSFGISLLSLRPSVPGSSADDASTRALQLLKGLKRFVGFMGDFISFIR